METSSVSKTSTITWITGLSTQAIPATVVSTVLSIFCYVTCYKNDSYLYLNLLLITISLLEHTEPISFLSTSISMNIIITATANNISLKLKQSKFLYTYFFINVWVHTDHCHKTKCYIQIYTHRRGFSQNDYTDDVNNVHVLLQSSPNWSEIQALNENS